MMIDTQQMDEAGGSVVEYLGLKSKRSRIIRPKPEPKPNIRLPLKEAEVSFENIRFRLNRSRIELPDFGCNRILTEVKPKSEITVFQTILLFFHCPIVPFLQGELKICQIPYMFY